MKLPLTFRPRERRFALIAMALVVCWLLVSVLVQPLWDRVHHLRLHLQTQTEKLDALSRLLKQAQAVAQGYQAASIYLETGDDERAQSAFLDALEALSQRSSVQLNLKPRPAKREGRMSRFEVELDVEGSQEHVLGFLDALLGMPRLLTIERLRISSVPAKDALLHANLMIQKLTLHQ